MGYHYIISCVGIPKPDLGSLGLKIMHIEKGVLILIFEPSNVKSCWLFIFFKHIKNINGKAQVSFLQAKNS